MVQFLPVDKVVELPWETIIVGVPPDAINSYSPTILGAIPWEDVSAAFNVDISINKISNQSMIACITGLVDGAARLDRWIQPQRDGCDPASRLEESLLPAAVRHATVDTFKSAVVIAQSHSTRSHETTGTGQVGWYEQGRARRTRPKAAAYGQRLVKTVSQSVRLSQSVSQSVNQSVRHAFTVQVRAANCVARHRRHELIWLRRRWNSLALERSDSPF